LGNTPETDENGKPIIREKDVSFCKTWQLAGNSLSFLDMLTCSFVAKNGEFFVNISSRTGF